MSNFDNIGQLMYLPLGKIDSEIEFTESEFILEAAVESVIKASGRNWIPLIVQELDNRYKLVSNPFVYAVMLRANLDKVWAIVIDPDSKNIEQAKILAREITPKINLSIASRSSIQAGLKFLQDGGDLKGVDPLKATNRLDDTDRTTWKDFTPITKLSCGITKAKIAPLDKVFYLEPQKVEPIPEPPKIVSVKKATWDEIFERLNYLVTYKIGSFEKVNPDQAADAIFEAQKTGWKSLNPIIKLDIGIDTPKIKTIKTVFTL
jgi:hypothetical protein